MRLMVAIQEQRAGYSAVLEARPLGWDMVWCGMERGFCGYAGKVDLLLLHGICPSWTEARC